MDSESARLNGRRMEIRLIQTPVSRDEVARMAAEQFGEMIKAVVDVGRGIMALGGDLHVDEEALLLENGSLQSDLWGINIYPSAKGVDWIEFDSMVNIRPSQGNRSRGVEDEAIRAAIVKVVSGLVAAS